MRAFFRLYTHRKRRSTTITLPIVGTMKNKSAVQIKLTITEDFKIEGQRIEISIEFYFISFIREASQSVVNSREAFSQAIL